MTGPWLKRLFFIIAAILLAAPITVVAGVSVNEAKSLIFPPEGFSLAWYKEIFADPGWRRALVSSVTIALLSAALSVATALPLAWFVWRRVSRLTQIFQLLGIAPFILPPVITALGFLSFWATSGFYGHAWTVVISHAIFFMTLPLVTLTLGFASIAREIVEAASTMGADDRTVLKTVILPLIRPYILSGFAFVFVLSLNEYIIAYMTVGFTVETLPIKIFNSLRYGYTPTMAAVTVFFVAIAAAIFSLVARFGDLPKLLGVVGPRLMRLAAFQMVAKAGDTAANLAMIAGAAAEAKARGAAVMVAPELAVTGYGAGDAIRDLAQPADGQHVAALAEIAAKNSITLVAGFAERAGNTNYNSAALIEPDGRRVFYRKCQLYGPYEKAIFAPGDRAPTVFDLHGMKAGLLICFDVEFPEYTRRLALAGADITLVPTAQPDNDYAPFIARKIVPVRAFENGIAIVYADHAGNDERFAYAGRSCIVMPDGSDAARAEPAGAAVIVADYEPVAYDRVRAENPYLADRRADSL